MREEPVVVRGALALPHAQIWVGRDRVQLAGEVVGQFQLAADDREATAGAEQRLLRVGDLVFGRELLSSLPSADSVSRLEGSTAAFAPQAACLGPPAIRQEPTNQADRYIPAATRPLL